MSTTSIPHKRKSPDNDNVSDPDHLKKDEYETGQVVCEVCGQGVSFRDEQSGGFTVKHWEAHRQQCASSSQAPSDPVIYTPESSAQVLAQPTIKRRRAKRTEEERIDYLRNDAYVAEFEPYRVLCASCDKWIRLRPNSTYCSIPWDAHRKSCLSKKTNTKNVYALDERNNLFNKDPDVRKFDSERVLCNTCDEWVAVSPDDHHKAVQKWLHHRSVCKKLTAGLSATSPTQDAGVAPISPSSTASKAEGVPPPSEHQLALASLSSLPRPASSSATQDRADKKQSPSSPKTGSSTRPGSPSDSSFKDFTPTNFSSSHEARRRNAEQRAATLRADQLIGQVEANRVFCLLCQKWVQLRQDSSYCAYPWLQHRGKCLARDYRRRRRAAEAAELKAKRVQDHDEDDMSIDELDMEDLESEEGAESEGEGIDVHFEENGKGKDRLVSDLSRRSDPSRIPSRYPVMSNGRNGKGHANGGRKRRSAGDSHSADHDGISQSSYQYHRAPLGLADLDSQSGRTNFIFASVDYLFTTTYGPNDDMTISALLTYLNSAMPPDKHEDFDTAEVIKASAALQDRGDIIFEGDTLRLAD